MFTIEDGLPNIPAPPRSRYHDLMEALRTLPPGKFIRIPTTTSTNRSMHRNLRVAIKRFWKYDSCDWRPIVAMMADGSVAIYRSDDRPQESPPPAGPVVEPAIFRVEVIPSGMQTKLRCPWCLDTFQSGVSCAGCGSKRCDPCAKLRCPTIGCPS